MSRLHSKKHPALSIMKDYQRQDYIARERVLNPGIFSESKAQRRYQDTFTTHPLYLEKQPKIAVLDTSKVPNTLSRVAILELQNHASCYGMGLINMDDLQLYSKFSLNGIQIRTRESEMKIATRDSI